MPQKDIYTDTGTFTKRLTIPGNYSGPSAPAGSISYDTDVKTLVMSNGVTWEVIGTTGIVDDTSTSYSTAFSSGKLTDGTADLTLGNLTVTGSTTTINSTTIELEDPVIDINNTGSAVTGSGLRIITPSGAGFNKTLLYDVASDVWKGGTEGSEQSLTYRELVPVNNYGMIWNNTSKQLESVPSDQNTIYVTKNGNDVNNGLTFNSSKLTISAALAVASSGYVVSVEPGVYTESITVPADVSVIASGSSLTGTITLGDNSTVNLGNHSSSSGTAVTYSGTASAYYVVRNLNITGGSGISVSNVSGHLICNASKITSTSFVISSATVGKLSLQAGSINSNTTTAFSCGNGATISVIASNIECDSLITSSATSGTFSITSSRVYVGSTLSNITTGLKVRLVSSELSGFGHNVNSGVGSVIVTAIDAVSNYTDVSGNLNIGGIGICSTAPTIGSHLTNKTYVDTVASGSIPTIGASTTNALVTWDGVSGDTIQNNSFVTIGPTGILSSTCVESSLSSTTGSIITAGGLGVGGAINSGGAIRTTNTTTSTSISTGALIATGGLGVGGTAYIGGDVHATSVTASTSTSSGALVVTGGVGIGGNIYVGGNAVSSTAPSIGTHLTNKTYVDGAISTAISGTGHVVGPGLATDNAIVRYDTTTGKLVQNTPQVTIDDSGNIANTATTASTSSATGSIVTAGGLGVGGAINSGGAIRTTNATASTSTSTGALIATGGLGVGGAINSGGAIRTTNATASTSTSTGALVVTGGLGVGGAINSGGNVRATGLSLDGGTNTITRFQTVNTSWIPTIADATNLTGTPATSSVKYTWVDKIVTFQFIVTGYSVTTAGERTIFSFILPQPASSNTEVVNGGGHIYSSTAGTRAPLLISDWTGGNATQAGVTCYPYETGTCSFVVNGWYITA